ncbi:MAG TPA: InlB B-repeat-containing protein [Acidimicrobiales bacterium]|nr:InlB B-repeat-containing protein [Acidimicrobiales bacterium]
MNGLTISRVRLASRQLLFGLISVLILSSGVPAFAVSQSYTVTFAENDGVSDSVSTYEISMSAQDLTLFSNLSPSFSDPGYAFSGWSTEPGGGGTSYGDGASYSFSSDIELYAQWTAIPNYAAIFSANGGAGSVSPIFDLSGTLVSMPSGAGFSQSDFTFEGWNTAANGTGNSYAVGASLALTTNQTFYAQWTLIPNYTVTFSANGGAGSVPSITNQSGISVPIPSGVGFSNSGFTFEGWNTAANGTGNSYAVGASLALTTNQTFYAQWTLIPTHTVTFVMNGGIGSVSSITDPVGTSVLLPSVSGVANTGYTFTGWNTAANGSGLSFADGASYALNADQTFYAPEPVRSNETLGRFRY